MPAQVLVCPPADRTPWLHQEVGMISRNGLFPVRFTLFTFVFACLALQSFALEPPTPEQLRQYRQDGSLPARIDSALSFGNHKVEPALVEQMQYRMLQAYLEQEGYPKEAADTLMTPPGAWAGGLPSKGNVKVLALLISFADTPSLANDTPSQVQQRLFGDGDTYTYSPYESLRNFYTRASYNQLSISGNVLGWYNCPSNRSTITQTSAGREALIKEALTYYDTQGHDFSQYDNNGDGRIDYFIVIWSGAHGAWASFWWGYQTSFSDGSYKLDGKTLGKYSWQWESGNYPTGQFTPQVVIHETGHALGLPDYYDYNGNLGPDGGVGGLDQMDSNWGDHNCFSKFLLDWITPQVVSSGTQNLSLRPSGTYGDAAIFMPGAQAGNAFGEFFMVQARGKDNNDATFPGQGLLVWHVDSRLNGSNYLYDNSYAEHKLLRLMEADGQEKIEQGYRADAGDYYTSGTTFLPSTTPATNRYDGSIVPMGIDSISAFGTPTTFRIVDLSGDTTPPTGTTSVPAGPATPPTTSSFPLTWTVGSAADPESGIGGYRIEVGTAAGRADLTSQQTARSPLTITGTEHGRTYYARVAALNGAGLAGSWSDWSTGIPVTAPHLDPTTLDGIDVCLTTSDAKGWSSQSDVSHEGGSAAKSGTIADGESSSAWWSVEGPGTLTFWAKVSSEASYDFLRWSMDGTEQGKISGTADWALKTVAVPAGIHRILWSYTKDTNTSGGSDCAWIDTVSFDRNLPGNLDASSSLDLRDLLILQNYLAGILPQGTAPFVAPLTRADVDGTPGVTASDAGAMADYLAGNRPSLP